MAINRIYINKAADIVRTSLSLQLPITKVQLFDAIKSLGGECIPVKIGDIKNEAQISTPGEDEKHSFTIKYVDEKPEKRVLFSIAHELGHLFLHLLDNDGKLIQKELFARNTTSTQKELEANEFAAALLMPEDAFVLKCRDIRDENGINITKVAEYFNVSVQAATVRGNVLGLW